LISFDSDKVDNLLKKELISKKRVREHLRKISVSNGVKAVKYKYNRLEKEIV